MNNHTDLLNLIAKKIKAESYLEIGVFNPDHNFNKINVPVKLSVDPDHDARAIICNTSDGYFERKDPNKKFDLIFIDGLHHADQVEKDIINSWNCLTPGGVIVLHDCNPPTEATTCVPRGKQREWCGNVYQTVSKIASPKFTVDFDYGCMVIRKYKNGEFDLLFDTSVQIDWVTFDRHRSELLNLISVEQTIKKIDEWN